MNTLLHRKPPTTWCAGCDAQRPVCAMNWTDTGQYRCRQCNPDPGPPHDAQAPSQHARSLRYAAAHAGTAKRHRCTECGTKLRRHLFVAGWASGLKFQNVELCNDCIGDNPAFGEWFQMELVR
jgi:hypothetical protein